jgi:hypothetical protein
MPGIMDFFRQKDVQAPTNLDAIRYVESRGMSPWDQMRPGPDLEIGPYQLTPPAWNELRQEMPKEYGWQNRFITSYVEPWARHAAADYQNIVSRRIKTNAPEAVAQAYNIGPTAYNRGERNPQYVKTYREGVKKTPPNPKNREG